MTPCDFGPHGEPCVLSLAITIVVEISHLIMMTMTTTTVMMIMRIMMMIMSRGTVIRNPLEALQNIIYFKTRKCVADISSK